MQQRCIQNVRLESNQRTMKEAVVYILDTSPSMNLPYPTTLADTSNGGDCFGVTTRLDAAKQALISMISELMLQSKTNQVSVILCKTLTTSHHMIASGTVDMELEDPDTVPFPNLTELTNGVVEPSIELLQRISRVECSVSSMAEAEDIRGDLCDALIVAVDALHVKTAKRKFDRKIVFLSDTGHDLMVDLRMYLNILDQLRSMDCRIEVIGLGFDPALSVYYAEKAPTPGVGTATNGDTKRIKLEYANDSKTEQADDSSEAEDDKPNVKLEPDSENESGEVYVKREAGEDGQEESGPQIQLENKEDRERFLQDMTEKTGGRVVAASTLQQILDANKGKKSTMSTRSKVEFRIAPDLSFDARYMLLMKKEGYPKVTTEVVLVDDKGTAMLDEYEKEVTDGISTLNQYVDEESPEDIVGEDQQTSAVRYGSDLVPMSDYDFKGLTDPSEVGPRLEVLGYAARSQVPRTYLIGPPYAISGSTSQKACAAISGLAKALHRLDKVAICKLIKTSRSSPSVGALFPLIEPEYSSPIHLMFLQLPFAGDVKRLHLQSFQGVLEGSSDQSEKEKSCDDLIDSLMLPESALQSGKVPSPFLRSWNQTKMTRAVDPKAPIVSVRLPGKDPMATPAEVLSKSKSALSRFDECFPLKVKKTAIGKKGEKLQGKSAQTYKDFLE